MFCPSCRSEFRAGIEWCASCETNLVLEIPAEDPFKNPAAMAKHLEGRELTGLVTGEQGALQQLQSTLAKQQVATVFAPSEGALAQAGRFVLMTAADDIERARALLSDRWQHSVMDEGLGQEGELDTEQCPACGADIPPEAEECGECGLFVGSVA